MKTLPTNTGIMYDRHHHFPVSIGHRNLVLCFLFLFVTWMILYDASVGKKIQSMAVNVAPSKLSVPTYVENSTLPSLEELVRTITNSSSSSNYSCPNGTIVFPDTPLPAVDNSNNNKEKKIPKIVHITAKTRCVPPNVYDHLKQWEFDGHALYFHDDDAVQRLLKHAVLENGGKGLVPDLEKVLSCVTAGATLSDIWRYTAMWYYGGIYTDLDNSPREFNGTTIAPEDDSFFPLEGLGVVGQFFFAASPRHPVMLLALHEAVVGLLRIANVMINNPALHTGPRALKFGFIRFQNAIGNTTNGYIPRGIYEGSLFDTKNGLPPLDEPCYDNVTDKTIQTILENRHNTNPRERRTITVVGEKTNSRQYVDRTGLKGKHEYMDATGMPHYHRDHKKFRGSKRNWVSCRAHIAKEEDRIRKQLNLTVAEPLPPAADEWFPRYRRARYIVNANGGFDDAYELEQRQQRQRHKWRA